MAMPDWLKNVISFLNGFRKFTIMMILIIVGVSFRLSGHLTGVEMVDLLKGTVVAFMAGNGIEHMTKAVVEWVKSK